MKTLSFEIASEPNPIICDDSVCHSYWWDFHSCIHVNSTHWKRWKNCLGSVFLHLSQICHLQLWYHLFFFFFLSYDVDSKSPNLSKHVSFSSLLCFLLLKCLRFPNYVYFLLTVSNTRWMETNAVIVLCYNVNGTFVLERAYLSTHAYLFRYVIYCILLLLLWDLKSVNMFWFCP